MCEPDPGLPDNAIRLAPAVWIAPADLRWSFTRSRGPGGQSVNKVSTKAELRLAVTAIQGLTEGGVRRLRRLAGQRLTVEDELLVRSDTYRSQSRNRAACLERLVELVTEAARPPVVRKATRPSRAAKRRRVEAKKKQGEKKDRRKRPDW